MPTIHLFSQTSPLKEIKIRLSFLLETTAEKLSSVFPRGKYLKNFIYSPVDYFLQAKITTHYELNDILKITIAPYSTFYLDKKVDLFDKENPLFFQIKNSDTAFFEWGFSSHFQINFGDFFLWNSKVKIRKIFSVDKKKSNSFDFDNNVNFPFLFSLNTIRINLNPISSKIVFSIYTTLDHWLMRESSSSQKIDSFDISISYYFQYNLNLSFYIHFNNLFDNVVYQIDSLKLKRGRNVEFGLEYKF